MMKHRSKHQTSIIAITISTLLICASGHAQYVWLDEKGGKQFSDLPPPVSVPKNRILKTPLKGNQGVSTAPKESSEAISTSAPNEKLQKPVTTASKNEDFLKRKLEQEEKEKKATAEKQAAADKAKYCERARSYQQSLESGIRIGSTDKNGERNFMSDAERAQELTDVKRALSECK